MRADLLRVLGESYLGLSDMKNAARVLERAVEEHAALLVRSRLMQARFLINEGRAATEDAERAAIAARDAALAILGPDHERTAHAFGHLATVYRSRGRPELAMENSRSAHELLLRIHGHPKHPDVIQAQNTYGRALNAAGLFPLAIPHLKESAANAQDVMRGDVAVQQFLGTLANPQIEYGEVEAVDHLVRAIRMDLRGVTVSVGFEASRAYSMGGALLAARRPAEALTHLENGIAL